MIRSLFLRPKNKPSPAHPKPDCSENNEASAHALNESPDTWDRLCNEKQELSAYENIKFIPKPD